MVPHVFFAEVKYIHIKTFLSVISLIFYLNLQHNKLSKICVSLPEECMMFDTCLPQFFRGAMIGKFEANCGLELLKFTRT